MADYALRQVVPALRQCGLTTEQIGLQTNAQALVYLLHRAGAPLHYRYKWEVIGPFSKELAQDLAELTETDLRSSEDRELAFDAESVEIVNRLTTKPPGYDELTDEEWLTLLVSVDFVERRVPGITENGNTPPVIALNYTSEAITAARTCVTEMLNVRERR